MFNHLLITRFNLRNHDWNTTKNNQKLLTDEWMEDRLWLFENFCFPSVIAQTNQQFNWHLFLDTTTTAVFKIRLENLVAPHSNVHLHYIEGMPEFYPSIQKLLSDQYANQPYIITSRIDNDDCISKNFINEIQLQFNQQDFLALDSIKGYSLQVQPDFRLGKKEHIYNPFISLIEKNYNAKTVWSSDHTQWKKEKRIKQLTHKRLWMSIIHESNKVNEFDGYGSVNWDEIKNDFILSEAIDRQISDSLIPEKKWRWLSFKNRCYVHYVLFSKQFKRKLGVYKMK